MNETKKAQVTSANITKGGVGKQRLFTTVHIF